LSIHLALQVAELAHPDVGVTYVAQVCSGLSQLDVRLVKAALFSGCKPQPAIAPASCQCRNASFAGGGMT
jgi:hypothetical protein